VPLPQGACFPVAFTAEDKYVVLVAGSHAMGVERQLWRRQDLIDRACTLLDRNLKPEEWNGVSNEAPPKTCPNLP
jgi:hypothetical protein